MTRICQIVGAVVLALILVSAACSGIVAYVFWRDAQAKAVQIAQTEQAFIQFVASRQDTVLVEAFKARFYPNLK